MYRAFPANAAFNAEHTGPIEVPLLLVGGEQVFGPTMPVLAEHLRVGVRVDTIRMCSGPCYPPSSWPLSLSRVHPVPQWH